MRRSVILRKLSRVDRALDKGIERSEMAGAVVFGRMVREGECLEHVSVRGLAVTKPERIPMVRETVFDLASLTKPIATATAIMLLCDSGALALDDPVSNTLSLFEGKNKESVTLRHLLTHSSGLRPWRAFHDILLEKERKQGEKWIATSRGRDLIRDRILRSKLVHEPGSAAVYGDLDFMLLGLVVEEVTKSPFEEYCAEHIFQPLGMDLTGFRSLVNSESAIEGERARGIAATEECPWRQRVLWGSVHDPNAYAMGGVAGHAGLFGPVDDVMKFAQTVLDVWHGRSDQLPRQALYDFTRRQNVPPGSDWALGWDTPTEGNSSAGRYFSTQSVGHLGFTGTSLWIDLEQEAIVVMLTNRIHLVAKRSYFGLRPKVHDLLIEAFTA